MVPEHSGPSPFTGIGAFGYGAWDVVTFGYFDTVFGTHGAQAMAAQHGAYYAGMAFGIAANFAVGSIVGAAAGAANASRGSLLAARAFVAYNVVGDAVGGIPQRK